jgi:hypothetical protein
LETFESSCSTTNCENPSLFRFTFEIFRGVSNLFIYSTIFHRTPKDVTPTLMGKQRPVIESGEVKVKTPVLISVSRFGPAALSLESVLMSIGYGRGPETTWTPGQI